jgi:hypothetical protein
MSSDVKNLKKYINFHNRSSTFKALMNNYKNKFKLSRDLNKEVILRQIYSKIAQIENNERENDFIISEVKRNAQINQEILYSFGTKSLNHLNEVFKINVNTKMDKNKFFGINNDDDNNKKFKKLKFQSEQKKLTKNNSRYKDNKFIILPNIIKKESSKIFNENDIKQNSKEINETNNMNINIPKNKRKIDFEKFNYLSFIKEKTSGYKTDSIKNLSPIIKKSKENSNDSIITVNSPIYTERSPKKLPKIDNGYINYIRTMGNQFSESEKKQEKYFLNNKYGVEAFKLKYNFLKKKYFN